MKQPLFIYSFFSAGSSQYHLAVIAALFLFSACKKEKDQQPTPGQFDLVRVKTITGADAADGWQATYAYDANKRVTKESELLYGATPYKISDYNYSGNKVTINTTENNTMQHRIYELNSQGFIKADTISDGTIYSYEYNDQGFLTRTYNNQAPVYERKYYYNSTTGLLDSTRSTIGTVWHDSQTYAYDMDRVNSLEDKNFGMPYNGNLFLRPVLRYEYRYVDGAVIKKQLTSYLYTYDEKDRIKSKQYENAGQRITYRYTYY